MLESLVLIKSQALKVFSLVNFANLYRTAPVAATDYSGLCNFVSNLTGHPFSRTIASTLYEFS